MGQNDNRYPKHPPKHQHDCERCAYLGQTIGRSKLVDLYQCGDTLIARYGDAPEDNSSTSYGMAHPQGHAELYAAQALADKPERT